MIQLFKIKILVTFAACLYAISLHADTVYNPHGIEKSSEVNDAQCLNCHKTQPINNINSSGKHMIPDIGRFVKSGTTMCNGCHGDDNSSHIVGISPGYKVPADLPLDNENKITCLTCHYVHGSLVSEKPMASTSFMDHLFNRDRLTKSYVLRRNNSAGDMCLACHSK